MNLIEPTYLRYVHDKLEKGSLNSENAAALPYGFIGLYEEAFQSNIPISKRQSTLKRLAIWALFKGGISTYLASQILNESQEQTKSLIDSFSSWFNTTDSNKYILYHDRLRTYLLQKLSSHELQELNEQTISYLETALEAQKGDEAEIYALEHLSTHMAVESQMDSNYDRLHDFANHEALWPRQVSVSKEYKWSQQAVQYSIKEGARRYHEMNTLSSTVNSVKLTQEEENSVNQIFEILKKGDYHTAIKRSNILKDEKYLTIFILIAKEILFDDLTTKQYKKLAYAELLKDENLKKLKPSYYKPKFIPENYLNFHLIKFHFQSKKLVLNDEKLLNQFNFYGNSIFKVLNIDKLSIKEINYLCEKFVTGQSIIKILLFVYENYIQKNSNSLSSDFLDVLSKAIKYAKNSKNKDWDYDNDFKLYFESNGQTDDICEKLLLIIINHSLYKWINDSSSFISETIENFKEKQKQDKSFVQTLAWDPTRSINFLKILKKIGLQKEINFIIYNQDFDVDDLIKICPYLYFNQSKNLYDFIIEKVNEDFEKAIIYAGICQEIINTKDISKLKNYQHKKNLYKFLEKIKEIICSLSDLENGKKINEVNLFKNIELHIKLFEIYFELDNLIESNYFIQEAIKLNGIIAERIFQPEDSNNIIYNRKYKNLGIICKAYLEKNQKQEFNKIFSESLEKINNYNSKDKITRSLSGINQILPSLIQIDENLASECVLKVFKLFNQFEKHTMFINFGNTSKYNFKKTVEIIISKKFKNLNQNEKDFWIKELEGFGKLSTYYLNEALNKISLTLNEDNESKDYLPVHKKLLAIQNDSIKYKKIDQIEILNTFQVSKIPALLNYTFLEKKLIKIKTIAKTKKEEPELIKRLKEYDKNLKNGKSKLDEINEIINEIEKVIVEERGRINLVLISVMVKDINIKLENIEKYISTMIEDYDDKTEAYFQSGNLLLKNMNYKRNGYDNTNHFNTAKNFIKLSLKTLFKALDKKDISNFNWFSGPTSDISRKEFLIKIIEILILNNGIRDIHEVCFEFREIFKVKYDSKNWDAHINKGKIIPEEFYFYFYEIISKKLIENGFIEEGYKIIELVLDKNQIAKIFIYAHLFYCEKKIKKDSLKPILNIIELIEESEPLLDYWDNHSTELQWPNKGYTYLELSEYFIKISDNKNAEKFIDKAFNELKEIDDKKIVIEKFNPHLESYDQTFKSQYNNINYSYFIYVVINKLLKIEKVEKSIELLKLINSGVHFYLSGVGADKLGHQMISRYPYSDSVYEIAWVIFRNDQKLALKFMLNNEKVVSIIKEKFVKEFIGKFNIKENILDWDLEFDKKNKNEFLENLSSKFNGQVQKDDKYYYLSKYFNDKENFHKILINESHRHFFIKNDQEKLDLIEQVIDIKEWREISASP